jgi:hypothetical protein
VVEARRIVALSFKEGEQNVTDIIIQITFNTLKNAIFHLNLSKDSRNYINIAYNKCFLKILFFVSHDFQEQS